MLQNARSDSIPWHVEFSVQDAFLSCLNFYAKSLVVYLSLGIWLNGSNGSYMIAATIRGSSMPP